MQISTIFWYEWTVFKYKFLNITCSALVSPLLYLIAFGWGMGDGVVINGISYINYILPGIIAMSTMNSSFSYISNNINFSRIYDKNYEEFITSPIYIFNFSIAKIVASSIRGMYSALLMIIVSFMFEADLYITPYFIFIVYLNCLVFAALGFVIGMKINTHLDLSKFTSFIITPMSFLCGTFFPVEKMPVFLRYIVSILPLTQTNMGLRVIPGGPVIEKIIPPAVLSVYFVLFVLIGISLCQKSE